MSSVYKYYKTIRDIPKDALEELQYEARAIEFKGKLDTIDDIIDLLKDNNDYSGDYVGCERSSDVYHYTLTSKTFKFTAIGRRYIKDSCICDEEMDESICITVLSEEKRHKETENSKEWDKLIETITSEIQGHIEPISKLWLDQLKKYKCPDIDDKIDKDTGKSEDKDSSEDDDEGSDVSDKDSSEDYDESSDVSDKDR